MEVRSGWNSEYARKKYDVTLDEGDLARILQEAGIPLEAQPALKLSQAHALLYFSAEIIARQTLLRYAKTASGKADSEVRGVVSDLETEIEQLMRQKAQALAILKEKHGHASD
jgi:hypothetical protein